MVFKVSNRILRVNQLVKKELSKILLREMDFSPGVLITITRVEVTPNLREAKVYISCFPEKEKTQAFQDLKREIFFIQKALDKRLKIKIVPKIKFLEEKKTKEADEVEEILARLKEEKK